MNAGYTRAEGISAREPTATLRAVQGRPSPRASSPCFGPPLNQIVKGAGAALGITPATAENYLSALYGRLGVVNEAQAVAWADDHLPDWRPPLRSR